MLRGHSDGGVGGTVVLNPSRSGASLFNMKAYNSPLLDILLPLHHPSILLVSTNSVCTSQRFNILKAEPGIVVISQTPFNFPPTVSPPTDTHLLPTNLRELITESLALCQPSTGGEFADINSSSNYRRCFRPWQQHFEASSTRFSMHCGSYGLVDGSFTSL